MATEGERERKNKLKIKELNTLIRCLYWNAFPLLKSLSRTAYSQNIMNEMFRTHNRINTMEILAQQRRDAGKNIHTKETYYNIRL